MNILFFLTPKSEVKYVYDDQSIRQVLEQMEAHGFSGVPIISRNGNYMGTITEGDLLRAMKDLCGMDLKKAESLNIMQVRRKRQVQAVSVDNNMEDMMERALNQNFVPVIDDQNNFIGIIKRREILEYFYRTVVSPREDN